jgi:hypothetical protein
MSSSDIQDPNLGESARNLADQARSRATGAIQSGAQNVSETAKNIGESVSAGGEAAGRRIGETAESAVEGVQNASRKIGETAGNLGSGLRRRVIGSAQDVDEGLRRRIGESIEGTGTSARKLKDEITDTNSEIREKVTSYQNDADKVTPQDIDQSSRPSNDTEETYLMNDPIPAEPPPPPKKGLWVGQKVPLAVLSALLLLCVTAVCVTMFLPSLMGGRNISTGLPPVLGTTASQVSGIAGSAVTTTNRITGTVTANLPLIGSGAITGTRTATSTGLGATGAATPAPAPTATPQPNLISRILAFLGLGGARNPTAPITSTVVAGGTGLSGGVAPIGGSPIATTVQSGSASSAITTTQRGPTTTLPSSSGATGGAATAPPAASGAVSATPTPNTASGSGATGGTSGGTTTGNPTPTPTAEQKQIPTTGAQATPTTPPPAPTTAPPPSIPASSAYDIRVCASNNFNGGCVNDLTVLPRGLSRIYASWSPAAVSGRNFSVVWYGMESGRFVILHWFDCNWNASRGTHTCAPRAATNSQANGTSSFIQANPTKWGPSVPANSYRVEILTNGRIILGQNFSVR